MLIDLIAEAGLFQFGLFRTPMGDVPFRATLDLLPSYPDILHMAAEALYNQMREDLPERLLCMRDDLPLGTALSLLTGIPLIYSRGEGEDAVHDLVGAYNSGHPTVMVLTEYRAHTEIQNCVERASRVGLEVLRCAVLFDTGHPYAVEGVEIEGLVTLQDAVAHLVETDQLPVLQARAVLEWIKLST